MLAVNVKEINLKAPIAIPGIDVLANGFAFDSKHSVKP
jgi:hypothetical protein